MSIMAIILNIVLIFITGGLPVFCKYNRTYAGVTEYETAEEPLQSWGFPP